MRYFIVFMMLVAPVASMAVTRVECKTPYEVDGWKGVSTHEILEFSAVAVSAGQLSKAQVNGAYASDTRDLEADQNYHPRSRRYFNFSRFGNLEDAWHFFVPLLPKDYLEKNEAFTGYLQLFDEQGFKVTHRLRCFVKN